MQSLIQPTDFKAELYIPNTTERATQQQVQSFIDSYQPKFLKLLFGDAMAVPFINSLAVNEAVLTFVNVSTASIPNYYAAYYNLFGNNPRVQVKQVLVTGNRRLRNDVFPNKTVVNGVTQSISFDFGEVATYEVSLGIQLADEESITFTAGSTNPLVIEDWQALYADRFGNNPRIDVWEIEGTNRTLRNDAGIDLIGTPLDSISIDFGVVPDFEVILYGSPAIVTDRWVELSQNEDLKQALRCYVYYYYWRNNVSFSSSMGEKRGQTQNSSDVPSEQKMRDRWNEMVRLAWCLNNNLDRTVYPEYPVITNYPYYRAYCLPEVYEIMTWI
jgi:hypothetical protein